DTGPAFLYLRFLRRRRSPFARVASALEDMRALVQDEIDLRRGAPSAAQAAGCPVAHDAPGCPAHRVPIGAGADMLDQLLRARRPDGAALTDRQIQIHLCDRVVAGHEPTPVVIAWTCYELCRHPEAMARLVAEIESHPAPRDAAALAELRYLEAVCQESLRLHPPLVFLSRTVAKPIHVAGHDVPPGLG